MAALIFAIPTSALTLDAPAAAAPSSHGAPAVEFEKMTWVEVKAALAAGRTTALIYTGGVEERGPQNANGGHSLMSHATVDAIARKLGNAIYLPVLPFTPNEADAQLPGTIGITNDLLQALLLRLSEQAIANGFKNVILMGDHGGGQPTVYKEAAKTLDEQYAAQGVHVYYCDQVYKEANDAFSRYLAAHGYPASLHGGIPDTSEMMYLDTDHTWVRNALVATALGSPVVDGKAKIGPEGPKDGIIGDARRSTLALGKVSFDIKVEYAVRQIRGFLAGGQGQERHPPQFTKP
jgi:creatinine amidohydrolase/Fe(II)-dependent formamide hydrolase-like protein